MNIECKKCDQIEVITDTSVICGSVDNLTMDTLTLYTWYRKDKHCQVMDCPIHIDLEDIESYRIVRSANL